VAEGAEDVDVVVDVVVEVPVELLVVVLVQKAMHQRVTCNRMKDRLSHSR